MYDQNFIILFFLLHPYPKYIALALTFQLEAIIDRPDRTIIQYLYLFYFTCSKLPSFDSIFDEETFYIFFILLVILSFVAAYIASRFINLEDGADAEIRAKKRR